MTLKKHSWLISALSLILVLSACGTNTETIDLTTIEYDQEYYTEINENVPQFKDDEIANKSFEQYSELDDLGRCGVAFACIGKDIMHNME